ncbi:MAG: ATP-dependent zinc protease [Thermodesulfobacteriota bacterium]|nr:ATP-dependent zinc protease [Thermodesulfobacteriota bacterium]
MKKKFIYPLVLLPLLFGGCAEQDAAQTSTLLAPPPAETAAQAPSQLVLIGETEYIIFKPDNLRMAARVDTGATTSSIGASAINEFERDGKKWVKFTATDPQTKKSMQFSRPVIRTIEVKRHGMSSQNRLVVNLPIIMGPIEQKTEFSLADRSNFEFPVLLGRSFLSGVAVVDVNREYVLSPLGDDHNEK